MRTYLIPVLGCCIPSVCAGKPLAVQGTRGRGKPGIRLKRREGRGGKGGYSANIPSDDEEIEVSPDIPSFDTPVPVGLDSDDVRTVENFFQTNFKIISAVSFCVGGRRRR